MVTLQRLLCKIQSDFYLGGGLLITYQQQHVYLSEKTQTEKLGKLSVSTSAQCQTCAEHNMAP